MASIGFSLIAVVSLHLVLLAATFAPKLPWWLRPLSALGIGSYVIYLFSDIVFSLIDSRMLACAATAALSCLSWLCFERPLISLGRRLFSYGRSTKLRQLRPAPSANMARQT